jgi:hypothetical protein
MDWIAKCRTDVRQLVEKAVQGLPDEEGTVDDASPLLVVWSS